MVWFDGARCYGADPDIWFPKTVTAAKQAKAICNGDDEHPACPAKADCLYYATFIPPVKEDGIWGGTTRLERRLMRKAARAA